MSYFHDIENVAHLPLPWEKLSGCNILITGATGLIGTCLTQVLMARSGKDYHVYATGRDEARAKERFAQFLSDPSFHFIPYDVTMPLEASGVPFHYIIHAASNASPNFFANHPVEVIKSNILGVSHLMEYGISHQMRRLLYVSTGEVYGEGDGHEFKENFSGYVDCTSSRSCYPSSKRAAETLCVSYAAEYGADVVIARPCHTYGPHFTEKDNRVYAQFIRNVLQGQDIIMKSTGEQFRSWCYVVDCVSALLYILLRGINGQAYNIADNSSNISIRNLAEMIAGIGGKEVVMQLPSDDEKKGYNVVTRSVFSTQKLESLGWSVHGSMIEKMERTVEECKNRK